MASAHHSQLIDPTQDNYRVANWAATPQGTSASSKPHQSYQSLEIQRRWHRSRHLLAKRSFNDCSWSSGRALFWGTNVNSAPAGPTNTYLAFTNPRQNTFYFRTHFTFGANPAGVTLTLTNTIDDGAVFYLNGQEAFDGTCPAGTVSYATFRAPQSAPQQRKVLSASRRPIWFRAITCLLSKFTRPRLPAAISVSA